jgi:hypothetical protein
MDRTENDASKNSSFPRERVYRASKPLPSNDEGTDGYTQTHASRTSKTARIHDQISVRSKTVSVWKWGLLFEKRTFLRSDTDRIQNEGTNNFSIVACVFVDARTYLPSHCLATAGGGGIHRLYGHTDRSGSTIQAFRYYGGAYTYTCFFWLY